MNPRLGIETSPARRIRRCFGRAQTARLRRIVFNFVLGVIALSCGSLSAAELRCPGRLPGPHPGFAQIGPIPTAHWLLWRMGLFTLPPDNDSQIPLLEREPDSTTPRPDGYIATWHFANPADLLMICVYDGSATYYQARPRPPPTSCTTVSDNGLTLAWCEQP
jgi:hypothetical protein